jgi:hypothetical protein
VVDQHEAGITGVVNHHVRLAKISKRLKLPTVFYHHEDHVLYSESYDNLIQMVLCLEKPHYCAHTIEIRVQDVGGPGYTAQHRIQVHITKY